MIRVFSASILSRRCTAKRLAIAAMLSITTGLLACGCMWGHVRDAETGLEVSGATVSWVDAYGISNSMTTGLTFAEGLYIFDCKVGKVPRYNPVTFHVTAPGYLPLVVQRQLEYDDNPDASFDDCSSFWAIEDFSLVPSPGGSKSPPPPTPTDTPVPPPTPTPTLVPLPRPSPTATPIPLLR
jgi:hypothetical protein